MKMTDQYELTLNIQRINNGYILQSNLEAKGSIEDTGAEYHPTLSSLDDAISVILTGVEKRASEMEEAPGLPGITFGFLGGLEGDEE